MRLTVEEHPEAIKRYAHIKRVRGRRTSVCAVRCPDTTHTCSQERGHRGPPVGIVEGLWGRVSLVLSAWGDVAMVVLFVAFVVFMAKWFLLILG